MPDATPPPRKFTPPVVPPPSITIRPRDKSKPPPPRGGSGVPPKPVVFKCGCRKTPVECGAMECPKHDRIARASKPRKRKPQPAPPNLDFGGTEPGRMPVNTSKMVTWDGVSWLGVMSVPGTPEPFITSAPTEKRCYHQLHELYLKHYRNTSQPG